jgi:RNA polymerase sigma factor (sigma-70 family)
VQPDTAFPERLLSYPPSREDTPTARLLSAATRGDQRAWDQLVERYSGLVWAITRGYRLGPVETADVVQTSWLRLIEHLPQIRNPDGIGGWLATTARRESLRAIRRTARCEPSGEIQALAGTDDDEVDAELLTAERDAGLWAAFERLPARDQALLRLLTTDPAPSYEEIGAALGMPIGSIGPTRARALERLRRELGSTAAIAEWAGEGRP